MRLSPCESRAIRGLRPVLHSERSEKDAPSLDAICHTIRNGSLRVPECNDERLHITMHVTGIEWRVPIGAFMLPRNFAAVCLGNMGESIRSPVWLDFQDIV